MVPVSTRGQLNRDGLELALGILERGNRVGIFPEGWGAKPDPEIMPLKRGVAFISQHSGRRVLPVALAGTTDLWRGKTLRVRIAPPLDALAAGSQSPRGAGLRRWPARGAARRGASGSRKSQRTERNPGDG